MSRNQGIGIVVILLMALLFLGLFERTDVEDASWEASFNPYHDEPYDISAFLQTIQAQYADSRIVNHYKDTTISEILSSGNLYIFLGGYYNYYTEDSLDADLNRWIAQGNTALIIANQVYLESEKYNLSIYTNDEQPDTTFSLIYCDYEMHTDTYRPHLSDDQAYNYAHFNTFSTQSYFVDSTNAEVLIQTSDTTIIMLRDSIGAGSLIVHSVPELYTNYASLQEFYSGHLDYTLRYLLRDPAMVIFDHPIFSKYSDYASISPIRFILSEPSLKWGYYLVLSGGFLYILFGGRRRQKAIPVVNKPVNSSIDFAETLSLLYAGQDKNYELLHHLESLFYHSVKKKYFILKDDPDFAIKLARKAHFPLDKINAIRAHFTAMETKSEVSDHQLGLIYGRLEDFHNHTI